MKFSCMNDSNLSDFNYIWDNWVVGSLSKIESQMDTDFKRQANVRRRNTDEIKKVAAEYFLSKREKIKKEYYGETPSSNSHLMDFHKLSAILCRTLIEYKVYDFDIAECKKYIEKNSVDSKNTDWLVHNALVNFRVAFYASIVFLYNSILFQLSSSKSQLYPLLLQQKKLNLYTHEDKGNIHESFENSLVLNLAKRDVNNRSFDTFLYSTIMYQLEQHNMMLLKNELKSMTE